MQSPEETIAMALREGPRPGPLSKSLDGQMPAGPDGELIWLCERMVNINKALDATYAVYPVENADDEKLRDKIAVDPLYERWFEAQRRMFGLPPPTTPEGVRAAAKVMLSYSSALDSYEDAVDRADVLMWLSRACAEFLARETGQAGRER
jgi:hypothetical protein